MTESVRKPNPERERAEGGAIVDRLGDRGAGTDSIPYPQTDTLVAVHAPQDDLTWGDDEGPLAFCTNLLRDADQ